MADCDESEKKAGYPEFGGAFHLDNDEEIADEKAEEGDHGVGARRLAEVDHRGRKSHHGGGGETQQQRGPHEHVSHGGQAGRAVRP